VPKKGLKAALSSLISGVKTILGEKGLSRHSKRGKRVHNFFEKKELK
jgi:hypothetical protein